MASTPPLVILLFWLCWSCVAARAAHAQIASFPTSPNAQVNVSTPAAAEKPQSPAASPSRSLRLRDLLALGAAVGRRSPSDRRPMPSSDRSEIERLLARAQAQIARDRLTSPASSNACMSYLEVLQREPSNPAAIAGLKRIADIYLGWAKDNQASGDLSSSLLSVTKGLSVMAQHNDLLAFRDRIMTLLLARDSAQDLGYKSMPVAAGSASLHEQRVDFTSGISPARNAARAARADKEQFGPSYASLAVHLGQNLPDPEPFDPDADAHLGPEWKSRRWQQLSTGQWRDVEMLAASLRPRLGETLAGLPLGNDYRAPERLRAPAQLTAGANPAPANRPRRLFTDQPSSPSSSDSEPGSKSFEQPKARAEAENGIALMSTPQRSPMDRVAKKAVQHRQHLAPRQHHPDADEPMAKSLDTGLKPVERDGRAKQVASLLAQAAKRQIELNRLERSLLSRDHVLRHAIERKLQRALHRDSSLLSDH